MKKILNLWLGNKLPLVYQRPSCFRIICFIKHWFFHPIKRRLARYYLFFLKIFFDLKVIGITGSAGKTTTKEMLAHVLSGSYKVVWSKDNIDPVYNIPSTILRCKLNTNYLILEMGVEYPGELDYYLWLAEPDIGIVTNIFPTHTQFFKDEKGVAEEKKKLVESLSSNGIAVLNINNKHTLEMSKHTNAQVVWFKENIDPSISNENAVKALAKYLKIPDKFIKKIKNYQKPVNRFRFFKHKSGAYILDDSYNSNPMALLRMLNYFNKISKNKKRILILGEMLELGKDEIMYHKKISDFIKKNKYEKLITIGKLARYFGGENFKNWQEALPEIKKYLTSENYLLIKGSRSVGLDNIVKGL